MKAYFRALHGPTDWGWVQQHERILRVEDTGGIVAIDEEKNETVAAVILDSWTPNGCQAHIIIQNPLILRHGFLEECFDFVFNVSGRGVINGVVKSDNEKALRFDKHIGFEETHRIKDGFDKGIDLIFVEIRKENCRWIKEVREAI